jgi:hypothetical protein
MTCIKMTNGNVYVVDMELDTAAARLDATDGLIKIPGTEGRNDFYINPLQVSAVYPARED